MDLECNSANHGVPHYAVCEKMIAWLNEFLFKISYSLQNTLKVVVVKWILSTKNENWNPLWKLEIAETEIIWNHCPAVYDI